jgi:ribosomal protein S18 acetylase RimI-like enzyme
VDDQIIGLERMAARHWRGTEEEWLGGWLLRAAEGFTGRANSALPLGDPGLPLDAALAAVVRWYRERGLPPMIAVPTPLDQDAPQGGDAPGADLDRALDERSWTTRSGPAFFMVADLSGGVSPVRAAAGRELAPGARFQLDAEPDQAWMAAYHYRGQDQQPPVMRAVLTSAADQVFVSLRDDDELMAIARLSIADGWAGITAVEVRPTRRRSGLGATLTSAVCAEAARRGVSRVFLQVETGNAPALALYERCGFRYSHRYHYRVAPTLQ